ncbi:hypothetical protein LINGRAPRIM_LOCUS3318 [Linum grandiflorum]
MEVEADHIGMLLMTSAGYDPRVPPKLCEKLSLKTKYVSTYLSGEKRSQLLAGAPVIEEALSLYRESEKTMAVHAN